MRCSTIPMVRAEHHGAQSARNNLRQSISRATTMSTKARSDACEKRNGDSRMIIISAVGWYLPMRNARRRGEHLRLAHVRQCCGAIMESRLSTPDGLHGGLGCTPEMILLMRLVPVPKLRLRALSVDPTIGFVWKVWRGTQARLWVFMISLEEDARRRVPMSALSIF